ncbi:MAG: hypothetical protein CMB76_00160 [Euryarchaeota archaeon]|nr:hypothetical protein [Euryarchaeota archaeon]
MAVILLLSTLVVVPQVEAGGIGSEDPGVSDTVTWRVGDKWVYAGAFDPTVLVQSAGVDAAVGTINGDATTTVDAVSEVDIDGIPTLVYETSSKADFDKGGVTLESYTGNLFIQYQVDEVRRVSDLAKLSTELSLNVRYVPYGISSLTQQIADITITTTYDPMSENYDFPLRIGETWNTSYVSSTAWSGSSDYITPFPQPTSGANHTNWEITDVGKPINSLGEQIGYGGCNASYELKSYDDNGTETSYEWFCPEVRNYAWSHAEEDIGLVIDFRLKQYMPIASTGVVANTNPGYRNMNLDVELSTPITALNTPVEVWANVTDSSGTPQPGQTVEIRHEAEGFSSTAVTAANGSAWAIVQVGEATDTSATTVDWSSHGIVASSGGMYGVATITLDENIVGLDLVAAYERSSILRNRSGELTTLNTISGFNVLPGDHLTIQLPVYNRGITTSNPTITHITYPDGFEISEPLPALALYEQYIFEIEWLVDVNSSIDNKTIQWEVDRQLSNPNDADSANDVGVLPIFIGSAPTYVGQNLTAWTNEKILVDASSSFDEDGGEVWCIFDIEFDDGTRSTANQQIMRSGCSINWTWIDDGIYSVYVTVTDEESDSITELLEVEIRNRAPSVSIISQRSQVKVEHPVTLYVFANDSDSEDPWPGLVDIHWPNAQCDEGYYTRVCTTTAWEEGLHTFTAVGTDDDGNQTYATIDIEFTNIAPHDVAVAMWDENDNLIETTGQMTWHIQEDQVVELSARAEDSIDDLSGLSYEWSFGVSTDGRESRVPAVWTNAGMQTILVKAIDSEGYDSGWVERWIDVQNLEPQIEELPEVMAVAEGQAVSLSGVAWDTSSDMEGLIVCWDVDPGADTDGIGSADDDCDVEGTDLTWSWQNSGVYNVVFHATDDNGARNSSSASITVLNLPPIVLANVPSKAIAGETVTLDASPTRDSLIDREYLTVVWDVDCSTDSDGDGIKDNDADLVGSTVEYKFPRAGKFKIKVIAWDEEIMNPSSKTMVVEVDSPDMTAFEEVAQSLTGEEANPFIQLTLIALVIAGIALLLKRGQKKKQSVWDDDDVPTIEAPLEAPSMDMFGGLDSEQSQTDSASEITPVPDEGLPEGWSMDQWQHYGHQYLEMQQTDEGQNEM